MKDDIKEFATGLAWGAGIEIVAAIVLDKIFGSLFNKLPDIPPDVMQ